MAEFVKVAKVAELEDRRPKIVNVKGIEIALVRMGEAVYALKNICPHKGGPVGEGEIEGTVITCPWHGWEFDLAQGGKSAMSEETRATVYDVRQDGDALLVEVPETP
ncbi:MAG: Rieske (2Fe-2S) protein [Nitrospirae bacterium]|nr:Rieske (2Fe-2S) protein [Nitrospirota bacterium]